MYRSRAILLAFLWTAVMGAAEVGILYTSTVHKRTRLDYIVVADAFELVPYSHSCDSIVVDTSRLPDPTPLFTPDLRVSATMQAAFCDLLVDLTQHHSCIRLLDDNGTSEIRPISTDSILDWLKQAGVDITDERVRREAAELSDALLTATTLNELERKLASGPSFMLKELRAYGPQRALTTEALVAFVFVFMVYVIGLVLLWARKQGLRQATCERRM